MDKQGNYVKLEFCAREENVAVARLAAAAFAAALDYTLSDVEEIKVVVSEAVSNAMIHGYCGDETRLITMALSADSKDFQIVVSDDGIGMEDIAKALEPAYSSVSDRMGLGFVFMGSFMDTLDVRSAPSEGTTVTMMRRRPSS